MTEVERNEWVDLVHNLAQTVDRRRKSLAVENKCLLGDGDAGIQVLDELPVAVRPADVLIGHVQDAGQLAALAFEDVADTVAGVENLGQDFRVVSGQALLNWFSDSLIDRGATCVSPRAG